MSGNPATIEIVNHQDRHVVEESSAADLIRELLVAEELAARAVTVVFVDDTYLSDLHARFLNDPSPTDIITFDVGDGEAVEGELYISVDRAAAHAAEFGVALADELQRLVIHGILHLSGMDDGNDAGQAAMRDRENHYLARYPGALRLE